MLLRSRNNPDTLVSTQDSVHNYYESLVIAQLLRASDRANEDAEFMADVTCVALNRLPPRYVRHDVDMTFFSPQQKWRRWRPKSLTQLTTQWLTLRPANGKNSPQHLVLQTKSANNLT